MHLLVVGSLQEGKGQKDAVCSVLALLEDGFDQVYLDIAGADGSEYGRGLKVLVSQSKFADHIRFLGKVKNPESLFSSADITLMCSKSEAFGRVTVEAMMAGSLIIGARSAGTLDIIRDGDTGLFYSPGDISDLKSIIEYAISHPDEARTIAKRGRADVLARFTAEENAKQMNELYGQVLGNK